MENMVIMAFDGSTTCTGVTVGLVNKFGDVESVTTFPIIPNDLSPLDFGYLKTKRKIVTPKKDILLAYVKYTDEKITKTEKERRDREVKRGCAEHRLNYMINNVSEAIKEHKPTNILMEANMAFRSMDITRKLAEVAGAIQAIALTNGVKVEKINVHTARAPLNLVQEMENFCKLHTPAELSKMDVTKEMIKSYLLKKYSTFGLNENMTLDESDSLLLFDHFVGGLKSGDIED